MPKLEGIEEKYWGKYKIDKENDNIIYSDDDHVYIDKKDNESYISVTTLIGKYSQTFDEEFWTAYKALEKLMDKETFFYLKKTLLATKKFDPKILYKFNIEESKFLDTQNLIKEEYAAKRIESCERGTKIHAKLENSFYNRNDFDFSKYGYADLHGQFDCQKNYYKLDLERGVYPEFLISLSSRDGLLRVAGQIDLLIKDGLNLNLIDWKSNAEIKKESYYNKFTRRREMMKYPLDNIMDTNYWHYTLQLSTYAYLLQQINPKFNISGLKIVHFDHDNKQHDYDIEYRKEDVEKMLKHYKRSLKVQKELSKNNPITI